MGYIRTNTEIILTLARGDNVGILDFNPLRVNRTNKYGQGINTSSAYMKPTHGYYLRWKHAKSPSVTAIFDKIEIPFLPDQGWNFRPKFSPSSPSSLKEWDARMPSYDEKWNPAFLTSIYMKPGAAQKDGLNRNFPSSSHSNNYAYDGKLSTTIDLSSDPCLKTIDRSDNSGGWITGVDPNKWNVGDEGGLQKRKIAELEYPNFRNPKGQAAVNTTFNMIGSRHRVRSPGSNNVKSQNSFWREKKNAATMGGIGPVLNKDDSIFYQPLSTAWRNEDSDKTFTHYYPSVKIQGGSPAALWPAWNNKKKSTCFINKITKCGVVEFLSL